MEKARRDALRQTVGAARRLVEDSLRRQLAGYGLFHDEEPLTKEQLRDQGMLRTEQEAHYDRVCDALRREGRATGAGQDITKDAVARYVRESGGTWINRLAALRALEARHLLVPEAARIRDEYGGLSARSAALREQTPSLSVDRALQQGVKDACRELSQGVRVLFDLGDEQTLFWPDSVALRSTLRLLSEDVFEHDWREADILGWVYQYYNTEANTELKRLRKRTTGFKYRPDDIPIANQFYTPHWVVRVLADNTLGRLWLEMRDRTPRHELAGDRAQEAQNQKSRLLERRRGVPSPTDDPQSFKRWISQEPDPLEDKTVDKMCRFLAPLPTSVPVRGAKPVRSIRVLDPACGSGHFLLYAFDLLFLMYREEDPALDPAEIPALILEHNLFGIDIDLRAAQLTAFSLYLKARTMLATIDPTASLRLRRLNIVVADAHIGDDPRKQAFLDRYQNEPEVQELYRKVLNHAANTNVLGSLLKVRTEFERLFGRMTTEEQSKADQKKKTWDKFGQQELIARDRQPGLREVFQRPQGRRWTLEELLRDLRGFEEEVISRQDIGAALFYTDLARTVGLVGLLSQQYDVILMNPPYGDMPPEAKAYAKGDSKHGISAHYPRSHQDYATAFLEQAIDLLHEGGLVGMLVSRSFMYLSSFDAVRSELLLHESRPELVLDLGRGILDRADVRVSASIVRKTSDQEENLSTIVSFNRLAYFRDAQRPSRFLETFSDFVAGGPDAAYDWFSARQSSLRDVPGMPYAYWLSDSLRFLFKRCPALDANHEGVLVQGRPEHQVAEVSHGLSSADDQRFVRFWWEIPPERLGRDKRWVPFTKGGSHIRFYARIDAVVNWDKDGAEIKAWGEEVYQTHWSKIVRNARNYFRPGVTWSMTGWRLRRFGMQPDGHIFSAKSCVIFAAEGTDILCLLGSLNSSLCNMLMFAVKPERDWSTGDIVKLPIQLPDEASAVSLRKITSELISLQRSLHEGDETCRDFVAPELMQILDRTVRSRAHVDLSRTLDECWSDRNVISQRVTSAIRALDDEVYRLYGISASDRSLIESELVRRPSAEGGYTSAEISGDGDGDDDEVDAGEESSDGGETEVDVASPSGELVARLLSYFFKQLIEQVPDGILPLSATRGEQALTRRLRERIEHSLGREAAQHIEASAPPHLGASSLDDWFAVSREDSSDAGGAQGRLPVSFYPWHCAIYRNRPIFWLLSSENFEKGKTRFTFRYYIYFLKLTVDTLPRLVAYYLDPTIDWVTSEWASAREESVRAEGKAKKAANAVAEEWLNTVDAMKRFKGAIESVIKGPAKAEKVAEKAKWLPRTIAAVRGGQDLGHGYRPDIDHGVRVNITPLVETRLLPRVVLKKLGG